jgi:serine/threonine protein kinase
MWGLGGSALAGAAVALSVMAAETREPGECKATRKINDFYRMVEKPIGSGGFGVVSPNFQTLWRGFFLSRAGGVLMCPAGRLVQVCVGSHRETGEFVAIKQLPKKNVRQHKVMQEIEILRTAGEHRNIIAFKDLFQDDDYWYIVMEMAEGGELFDRLVEQVRAA